MGRAVEIIPNLWLGDKSDAKNAFFSTTLPKKTILCMHEELPNNTPHQLWFPLGKREDQGDIETIDFKQLELACDTIDEMFRRGRPVLVHCYAGVERSPLTVAWYLYTRGHFATIHAAYEFIQKKRPIVQDRICWLPEDIRLKMVGVTGAEASNNDAA